MEICVKMNGAQCAESFCPLWSYTFKRCSEAVEVEKRAEFWDIVVEQLEKAIEEKPNQVPKTIIKVLEGVSRILH